MKKTLLLLCVILALLVPCAYAEETVSWENVYDQHVEHVDELRAANAPKVTVLENGVKIQRTPTDGKAINTSILKADSRGCGACHADLAQLMADYDLISTGKYEHFGMTNNLGLEITYTQCLLCHTAPTSSSYDKMGFMMHGIHSGNAAFEAMGGNCWSCHYADETSPEMLIWDEVKYDKLKGITKLTDVHGEFHYDQDVVSGLDFNIDWMYDNDNERMAKYRAGIAPDPENDGMREMWNITVTGEVEQELTFNLAEMIADESVPKVTKISKAHCTINGNGGPLIANVEVTGIPFSYLTNQAGIKANANVLYDGSLDNMSYARRVLAELDLDNVLLVYEVNGEPLSYEWGYPVVSWFNGLTCATENRKQITHIILAEEDVSTVTPMPTGRINAAGEVTNNPNLGIANLMDGQVFEAGQPITIEGYADAFDATVGSIDLSFDNGATWTSFDVSDNNREKWVYWYFTFTPEKAGSYVVTARCTTTDGVHCYRNIQKLINVQ